MMLQRFTKPVCKISISIVRNLSNKSCIFTKPRRRYYLLQYPTTIVRPDGSTYKVRHDEPRAIIKLPLDISTLTEEQRLEILENRRPKKKVKYQEEDTVDFNPNLYLKYIKK